MPQIKLTNTVDAWVGPGRVSKFGDTRLYVHSEANTYLTFTRPKLPQGSVITSAVLRVHPGPTSGSGTITVNLHKLTEGFDPNSVSWDDLPTVSTLLASVTGRTWYASAAPMDFAITAEVQNIIDGGAWFGWRLSSSSTDASQFIYSGQSELPMTLTIDYTAPPPAPIDLYPNSNGKVNSSKPTLMWTSPGSQTSDQLSFQVQVASDANFTTSLYTSNEISSKAASYDLNTASPTFTALTNGQSRWWRVRVKNTMGLWSPYSAGAQFTFESAKIVTITAPSGTTFSDPTPVITWTYSGTQQAYQVLVTAPDGTIWDSAVLHGTTQTLTLPTGVVRLEGNVYKVLVRVWANTSILSVPGTPAYDTASKDLTWTPTGAVEPVQLLITPETPLLPARLVRWEYTSGATPSRFYIRRWRNGVQEQVWDLPAAPLREGVTNWYRMVDGLPPGRADVTYTVNTILSTGATSAAILATVKLNHKMPWILSVHDRINRAFCLVNYTVDSGLTEISNVVTPINGAPYLALQSVGRYNGSMSGIISGAATDGNPTWTSAKMKEHYMWMRNGNRRVYMVWQDQAIEAFIYQMTCDSLGVEGNQTDYAVSFNFVQV